MRKSIILGVILVSIALPTSALAGTIPIHGHIGNIPINGVVEEHEGEREPTSPQEAVGLHATLRAFGGLAVIPVEYNLHYLLTISQRKWCGNCASYPSLSLARATPRAWRFAGTDPSGRIWNGAMEHAPISCTIHNTPIPTPDQGEAGGTTLPAASSGTAGEGWTPNLTNECSAPGLEEWENIQLGGSVDDGIFYPDWQKERSFGWEASEG